MSDQELLDIAEVVLRDAMDYAEFTELPRELAYVKLVAQKVENLRAKIAGRAAATVANVGILHHRLFIHWFPVSIVPNHFVSASCKGEFCGMCYREEPLVRIPASHKVGEEFASDDPSQMRHNLTQYVCCLHFKMIVGPAAKCGIEP